MTPRLVYGLVNKDKQVDLNSLSKTSAEVLTKISKDSHRELTLDDVKEQFSTIEPLVLSSYKERAMPEYIEGVALKIILTNPVRATIFKLPSPNRHENLKDLIRKYYKKTPEELGKCTYGFYSSENDFLNRTKAQVVALEAGQISVREREKITKSGQTELQSPNVW